MNLSIDTLRQARKAFASAAGLGLTYATMMYGGNPGDVKWITLAVAVASVAGVYSVPNQPGKVPPVIMPPAPDKAARIASLRAQIERLESPIPSPPSG